MDLGLSPSSEVTVVLMVQAQKKAYKILHCLLPLIKLLTDERKI